VFLPDPNGIWEMEARRMVLDVSEKRPKIKGQIGRQYFVARDVELATAASLFIALSN
jgi:hypothetical protein